MRLTVYMSLILLLAATAQAKINTYVSIPPQKFFLEKIGGEKVQINVMVLPGANPATYEPKPKQMADMSKTDIYFSIGVPFENTWLKKLSALNPDMIISPTDEGIKKRTLETHHHEEEESGHNDHDDHDDHDKKGGIPDPHVWLDPVSVIKQAENITSALCSFDTENCNFYKSNKDSFVREVSLTHNRIERIFKNFSGKYFMVFHPSWGYFADRYGLKQIPVELGGKEPKPSDLKDFINQAVKLNLKAIFVQPQFSTKSAELIAKETGATVTAADPLSYDWSENLIKTAKIIAGSF